MKAGSVAILMALLFVAAAGLVAAEHEDWDGDEESGDSSPNMCEKGTHFRGDATAYMACEMKISDRCNPTTKGRPLGCLRAHKPTVGQPGCSRT